MSETKQKRFLLAVAFYGVIIIGIYAGLKYLLPPLMPFLFGLLIAWMLKSPAQAIARKLHIKSRIPAMLLAAVFYLCAAAIVSVAGIKIVSTLKHVLPQLPTAFSEKLMPFLTNIFDSLRIWLEQFDPDIADTMSSWFSEFSISLEQAISSLSAAALRILSNLIAGIPSSILKIVLTVVSTFFISIDYDRIIGSVRRILPDNIWNVLYQAKVKAVKSIKIFIKSYALIFVLSFVELSIGFLIMRIPHAIGIALLVSIIDIMPVLGTGLVLLPWAIIAAVTGNVPLAIGMILLYVFITIVRNIVEPKLVGGQMGLHPLLALISMTFGLQMFGLAGMIICPLLISLCIQMHKDGVISFPLQKHRRRSEVNVP